MDPRTHPRPDRGAAAVEGALLISFLLIPLLMGVLTYGDYFWRAQRVGEYVERAPIDGVAGRFANCGELVARVKSTLSTALSTNLDDEPVPLENITVTVVELLPTVGAVVEVSILTDVSSLLSGLVPLPHDGAVLTELTFRLDDVVVTTNTCA